MTSKKRSRSIGQAVIYLVLTVGVLFWILPFAWMFLASLKPTDEIFTRFWPTRLTLEHYRLILQGGTALRRPFLRSVFNNFFVSIVATVSIIVIGALTGYALGRLEFKGRDLLYNIILYQMVFPGILFLIPTFLLVLRMRLVNTYSGMIIRFLADATAVFLFTQFFKTIPRDLIDAARVDGAGELTILWRIMLPLSGSVTAFVAIFNFQARWNEFLWNLIVAKNYDLMTLPVMLASFTHEYGGGQWAGARMAGATVLTLPILILFVLARRFFEEGIVTSGLKG
ncbi:MAG: carbohydrate ABC transporter permease [Chloroflexota bacterium]|nr:carbohydrate ABC transporter permease [Chloroflexota bacterium]